MKNKVVKVFAQTESPCVDGVCRGSIVENYDDYGGPWPIPKYNKKFNLKYLIDGPEASWLGSELGWRVESGWGCKKSMP